MTQMKRVLYQAKRETSANKTYASIFKALASPSRLQIINLLSQHEELCVCHIQEALRCGQPLVSYHLAILEEAGLIERRVERQWRYCRVRPDAIRLVDQWLERYRAFWDASFDRLERLLAEKPKNQGDP